MLLPLKVVEILEIAIQAERQGAAFYERLATTADSERVRAECQRIVGMANW